MGKPILYVVISGNRHLGVYTNRDDAVRRATREASALILDVAAIEHVMDDESACVLAEGTVGK